MSQIVAVTGARGFFGRYVVAELDQAGLEVVEIGRDDRGSLGLISDGRVDSRSLDDLFAGVDSIVHLAGRLSTGPDSPVAEYLQANVALTEEVVLAAGRCRVSKFVFSSTRLVYPSDLGRPAREGDEGPDSGYGISKLFAERVLDYHARRLGIAAVSLRISQLLGYGDGGRGVLARFADAAHAGGPITVTGDGVAVRDFVDVRDAARAVRLAVEQIPAAGAVNIGGGGHSIRELADAAASAADLEPTVVQHEPTDGEDTSHWALDSSLARRELGWEPEYGIESSLRDRWTAEGADAPRSGDTGGP